jgi:predicted nucleotidyltransferase
MGKKVINRSELTAKIGANAEHIRSFGIERISVFGSFARDQQIKPSSDIDFVLDFQPGKKNFDNLVDLGDFLENLLGRKVELLTRESLKSATGKHILATAQEIAI